MLDAAAIPGMIEPVEQQALTQLASEVAAAGTGAIVEFGCFFGRSTACLVNGVRSHWDGSAPAVHAYDSFGCADGHGFAPHVRAFARRSGLDHLLVRQNGRLDFYPVYRHALGPAEDTGVLRTVRTELRDAQHDGGPIALMHIDAPKFYSELKPIMARFFPHLAPGAAVVFQDHMYHWSATLIAAVQLLIEAGLLRVEGSRASARIMRVERAIQPQDLLELDLAMAVTPAPALIDRNLESLKAVTLDRVEVFTGRLRLAKVQWFWEQGDFAAAHAAFAAAIEAAGGRLSSAMFADFQDLMRNGFTLRKLSEMDH